MSANQQTTAGSPCMQVSSSGLIQLDGGFQCKMKSVTSSPRAFLKHWIRLFLPGGKKKLVPEAAHGGVQRGVQGEGRAGKERIKAASG